jgi:hypothetical protein
MECTVCYFHKQFKLLQCCNKKLCIDCLDKVKICPWCRSDIVCEYKEYEITDYKSIYCDSEYECSEYIYNELPHNDSSLTLASTIYTAPTPPSSPREPWYSPP